jgi:hypothetical protein
MPAPPPKGRSSTTLCLPAAQSRMFQRLIVTNPLSSACFQEALGQVTLEHLGEQSQDVESMGLPLAASAQPAAKPQAARSRAPQLTGVAGCSAAPGASASSFSHFSMYFLNSTRTSPTAAPTLIQYLIREGRRRTRLSVSDHRVVGAEFLDHAAVARLPRIDGHNAEVGPMLAASFFMRMRTATS